MPLRLVLSGSSSRAASKISPKPPSSRATYSTITSTVTKMRTSFTIPIRAGARRPLWYV